MKLMIRVCFAALATGFLSEAAIAQQALRDWSGPYIGVHGGYGWSSIGVDGETERVDLKGALGGLHGGYLWQWNQIVYGLEADVSFGDITYKRHDGSPSNVIDFTTGNDWLASVRGRLGYDVGPALVFATGGVAWTEWSFKTVDQSLCCAVTDVVTGGATSLGWVVGGGAEIRVTDAISFRLEGLHYRFDHGDVRPTTNGVPDRGTFNLDQSITVARGGINWRF